MNCMRGQAATEYLVLIGVALFIGTLVVAILVWPTGSSSDVKQSQKDISLGIGKIAYPELAQGLIAYYKFDEGVGDNAYSSAGQNLNDATLYGGVGWTNGVRGKAATFDRVDDYGLVSYKIPNTGFTIAAWINSGALSGNRQIISSAGNLQFYISANNLIFTQPSINGGGVISANTWYHVAVVSDGTEARIYLNGAKLANASGSGGTTTSFYIGAYNPTTELFNGTIDDLHIYNRVLSPQEIELLYKNPGYP